MKDNFAHISLPPLELQPEYTFLDLPQFQQPELLNCVEKLLDNHIKEGRGNTMCIRTFEENWTYQDLYDKANQIAHVLVEDLGLVSGNRVMLRSANNPMMVACWFAVLKAGGIVVATMPLLRAKELTTIIDCAEISHAICDSDLAEEMNLPLLGQIPLVQSIRESGDIGRPAVLQETTPQALAFREMAQNIAQQVAILNANKMKESVTS